MEAVSSSRYLYRTALSWRAFTFIIWLITRAGLFANIVWGHHLCDRVFWLYGHRAVELHMLPYRDFAVEYPPLAAVLFMIPGAAATYEAYAAGFALVMLLADLATVLLVRYTAGNLGPGSGPGRWSNGWQAAFFYVLLSGVNAAILVKFDLLPGMLTLAAVALLVQRHERSAWALLAAAVLLKGYAVVLAPLFLLYQYQMRAGPWWRGPLTGALSAAAALTPVFLLAGPQFVHSLLYHARRGLELESVYASIILLAHQLYHLPVTITSGAETTSRDIFSSLNQPLLMAVPWALAAGLMATYSIAWLVLRRHHAPRVLLLLCMAAVASVMVTFKALPSYYLLWLIPMAPVALGPTMPRAGALRAAVALCLADGLGALIPTIWTPLRHFDSMAIAAMVGRNVAIIATLVLLLACAWDWDISTSVPGHRGHLPRPDRPWLGGAPRSSWGRGRGRDCRRAGRAPGQSLPG